MLQINSLYLALCAWINSLGTRSITALTYILIQGYLSIKIVIPFHYTYMNKRRTIVQVHMVLIQWGQIYFTCRLNSRNSEEK